MNAKTGIQFTLGQYFSGFMASPLKSGFKVTAPTHGKHIEVLLCFFILKFNYFVER
jgi:hypothetical protein